MRFRGETADKALVLNVWFTSQDLALHRDLPHTAHTSSNLIWASGLLWSACTQSEPVSANALPLFREKSDSSSQHCMTPKVYCLLFARFNAGVCSKYNHKII